MVEIEEREGRREVEVGVINKENMRTKMMMMREDRNG